MLSQLTSSKTAKHPRIAPAGLSVPDVMEALGLSRQTVYDAINAGELRSFKIGRRRLISPAALTEYVAAREAANVNPKAAA